MGEILPIAAIAKAPCVVRLLGRTQYADTWRAMQNFTAQRLPDTPDELWLTEHPPVYTLGLNKQAVSAPLRNDIPLIETDRGGKITYHGPGQIVLYLLLDLKRMGLSVRPLVNRIEGAVIALLDEYGIPALGRADAPGVYVNDEKIASLGLRLKNGCCYHGLALNVHMDLSPFSAIAPCGYQGLKVTQMHDLGVNANVPEIALQLVHKLTLHLSLSPSIIKGLPESGK